MKFSLFNLSKPTPRKVKVFGKALVTAATSAAALNTVGGGSVAISMVLVAAGFIGSFLGEFFTDSETPKTDQNETTT